MKTFLVPVDFSDSTASVIKAAEVLASAAVSRVVLLHVTQQEMEYSNLTDIEKSVVPASFVPMPPLFNKEVEKVKEKLDELKEYYSGMSNDVVTLQRVGDPVEVILEECGKQKADVIIIGSHGHGALYNLLVGSVTSGVLKSATCPVLVVPSPR